MNMDNIEDLTDIEFIACEHVPETGPTTPHGRNSTVSLNLTLPELLGHI